MTKTAVDPTLPPQDVEEEGPYNSSEMRAISEQREKDGNSCILTLKIPSPDERIWNLIEIGEYQSIGNYRNRKRGENLLFFCQGTI